MNFVLENLEAFVAGGRGLVNVESWEIKMADGDFQILEVLRETLVRLEALETSWRRGIIVDDVGVYEEAM